MVAQPTNKKKAWPRTGTGAGTGGRGGYGTRVCGEMASFSTVVGRGSA